MKNITEKSNDDSKEDTQSENKMDDNSQHSSINLNKNNMENIYKLLINDNYYSILQNLNNVIKNYHKLLMQNIGKMNKILLNKIKNSNNNDCENSSENDNEDDSNSSSSNESKGKDFMNISNSLIEILNQVVLIHDNFYLNSKKLLLKIKKYYNKRKKKFTKYKIIEKDKYSFIFGIASGLKKNNENEDINLTQKFKKNSNQVIINNIQNIINTIDNKSNDIISNSLNQNDFSFLLNENQILKQKLTNITTNQKSEITNYINYIENQIKNDNNNNNIINIEKKGQKIEMNKLDDIHNTFKNLEAINQIKFDLIYGNINDENKNIIHKKEISLNLICQKDNLKEIEQINKLTSNKELSAKNNELKEKINNLSTELKKTKEEKKNIVFKNGLTEKKVLKLNSDIDKLKKFGEQKDADIFELNEKIEQNKLKISELENQKSELQNKIFNCMSKISDLSSNYEKLEKEKEAEIGDYKEYLNEKEEMFDELKLKNKQSIDKIILLEENIKSYTDENQKLKTEINNIKKNNIILDFKIKQNEKTIIYLNKEKENLIKENGELKEQIKILNKDIKDQKKIIKEFDNKSKSEGEEDPKEVMICKDKKLTI